jgi:uncharacterized protein with PIN domain
MKFFCDYMLVRLGKWLRAAGYDTKIATPHQTDQMILEEALGEKRYLVTRDSHFLQMIQSEYL